MSENVSYASGELEAFYDKHDPLGILIEEYDPMISEYMVFHQRCLEKGIVVQDIPALYQTRMMSQSLMPLWDILDIINEIREKSKGI